MELFPYSMEETSETATVTSNGMVNIPARLKRKYGIHEGTKVLFVEQDGSLLMVPLKSLREMRGLGRGRFGEIVEGIRELEVEHRRESAR
jgi:AbrB family looped-hinge helix DNA binding protein